MWVSKSTLKMMIDDAVRCIAEAIIGSKVPVGEVKRINRAHRGWRKLVAREGFRLWLYAQPAHIRRLADSPHVEDAIHLLNLYKGLY